MINEHTIHQTGSDTVFNRLEAEVIRPGLCTHCGTCIGLSKGALRMQATQWGPIPVPTHHQSPISLPPIVLDACPGYGIHYPDLCRSVFGEYPSNWFTGCYQHTYIGYASIPEVRRHGASGGVITQTLLYLLEQGLVDGAVVVRQGQPQPWQAEPIIARTPEEIMAASQSVYAPVPVNTILEQMEAFDGRLAYVGLPDQVASLRRLQQLGHPAVQKVNYVLGPYVGTCTYFAAVESYLRSNGVQDVHEITELRYREGEWPGYLQIKTRSGKVLRAEKFYYNYLIPFYITRHSLLSVDFTNELTDISVGDAWSPEYEVQGGGFSVVVSRSHKGEEVLTAMHERDLVHLQTVSLEKALAMHGHMLDFKKRGAFIRMEWRKAAGQPVPTYGYRPSHIPLSRRLTERVITTLFALCGTYTARRIVELVPIAILGPLFNTLRKTWKRVSKPVKRKGLHEVHFYVEENG